MRRLEPSSRRAVLGAMLAAPCGVSLVAPIHADAVPAHADAAILALEPELARLHREQRATHLFEMRVECRAHRLARARLGLGSDHWPISHPDWSDALRQAKRDVGFYEKEAANEVAFKRLKAKMQKLVAIRATTLDGLLIKRRYGENWEIVEESILADLSALNRKKQRR